MICLFLWAGKIIKSTLPKREHPLKDKIGEWFGGDGGGGSSTGLGSGLSSDAWSFGSNSLGSSYGSYSSLGSSSYGFDSFDSFGGNSLW